MAHLAPYYAWVLDQARSLEPTRTALVLGAGAEQVEESARAEVGEGFPEKVTAFLPGMAVHGKFKEPCPDCGARKEDFEMVEI